MALALLMCPALPAGEWALETGVGFRLLRRGGDRGVFPLELLYGVIPNAQLGLGTVLSTAPREIDEQTRAGDLQLSGLVTKTFDRLSIHFNAGYELALGASYPIDAPRYTRTMLVGDVFTEQSSRRSENNTVWTHGRTTWRPRFGSHVSISHGARSLSPPHPSVWMAAAPRTRLSDSNGTALEERGAWPWT